MTLGTWSSHWFSPAAVLTAVNLEIRMVPLVASSILYSCRPLVTKTYDYELCLIYRYFLLVIDFGVCSLFVLCLFDFLYRRSLLLGPDRGIRSDEAPNCHCLTGRAWVLY